MKLDNIKNEFLNTDLLLKHLDQYNVYAYYLGNFDLHTIISSPFRKDNHASFGIFYRDGNLIFNDFKLGGGNCIAFVSKMEFCSYQQAMGILNKRYNLNFLETFKNNINNYSKQPLVDYKKIIKEKPEYWIDVLYRPWQSFDKDYWIRYEISLNTLQFYDVNPISRFWINKYPYYVSKHTYSYYYDNRVYKIYQPFKTVETGKFHSNIKNKDHYQGDNQLPDNGKILFITSSLKDVMVLYEAGYWAIAPHTEHQILTDELYKKYNRNWNNIIILYDNDEAGLLHAKKMVDKYNLPSLVLPDSNTKDPSDFVENYSLNELKQWILNNI